MTDEMSVESDLQEAFLQSLQATFVGRKKLISAALQKLKAAAQGLVLVHGKPGTGKSAFMVSRCENNRSVVVKAKPNKGHFCGGKGRL